MLSLDDTIGERLPDLPEEWGEVTLRQLLNHTSGLPDFTRSEALGEMVIASPAEAPPPEELLSIIEDEPLVFPPGTQYTYSNSDNIVVALMIQSTTGRSYADVLQTEVLDPLGLAETSLPEGDEIPEPLIRGYAITPDGDVEDETFGVDAGWAWASGGVVSTPADLNTFIRGYVGGDLYSDAVREEQQALFIPAGGSDPLGPGLNSASLALFRYETPCGTVYGHSGNTFGYTQYAFASPSGERSATVSITIQRTQDNEGPAAAVFDAFQRLGQAAICLAMEGA